jgi:hypothetical protein
MHNKGLPIIWWLSIEIKQNIKELQNYRKHKKELQIRFLTDVCKIPEIRFPTVLDL